MSEQAWVKSSYSGSQANCVEVAVRDRVVVRDTKDRTGTVLRFTPAAWRDFAGRVKAGERSLRNGFSRMAGGRGSCLTRGTRRTRSGLNLVIHRLPELNPDDESATPAFLADQTSSSAGAERAEAAADH